jgi:enoyl-CoA hydratase/carnithine racemase
MDFANLDVNLDGPVGTIRLIRSQRRNSLSLETLNELIAAAAACNARDDLRVVVVSGEGASFCAGADLGVIAALFDSTMAHDALEDMADLGRRMAEAIESIRAVTIAAIHGHCVGGGVVLAAACDVRLAAEGTEFSIPETAIGIPLAWGGIPRLVRTVGPAAAIELILTCRVFEAEEARRMGFVSQVVEREDLENAAHELAATMAERSLYVIEQTKAAVLAATDEIVSTSGSHTDAGAMIGALSDDESREIAEAYFERFKVR